MNIVYLSRRNLLTLLSKLDRVRNGETSFCAIEKKDDAHPVFPQSMPSIIVQAVEDEDYYKHRKAGSILDVDETEVERKLNETIISNRPKIPSQLS